MLRSSRRSLPQLALTFRTPRSLLALSAHPNCCSTIENVVALSSGSGADSIPDSEFWEAERKWQLDELRKSFIVTVSHGMERTAPVCAYG